MARQTAEMLLDDHQFLDELDQLETVLAKSERQPLTLEPLTPFLPLMPEPATRGPVGWMIATFVALMAVGGGGAALVFHQRAAAIIALIHH